MICPSCRAENEDSADACGSCGRELFVLAVGRVLSDRYEIRGRLGKGGMGVVYRARDRELDEDVALKTLRPDVAGSPAVVKRFRSEIKLARTVSHPNVCRIHDYGRDGDLSYIVMERVDGVDLKRVVQESGALPPARAYEVAIQIAEALQAIHDGGIVHRDLKTQNVMQDERGLVKLMDFGIAKRVETPASSATTDVTGSGQIIGTPEYMSPEQVHAEALDARSDVYALGIVVFELFTGDVPFRADSFMATAFKQVHDAVPLSGPRAARIPPPLAPVLRRALAKAREERFRSAREMAEALRTARDETLRSTRADTAPAAGRRPPTVPLEAPGRRPRWLAAAVAVMALSVALGLVAYRLAPRDGAPVSSRPIAVASPTAAAPTPTAAPVAASSATVAPAPARTLPSIRAAAPPLAAAAVNPEASTALTTASREPAEPPAAPSSTATSEPSARVQLAVKPWAEVTLDGNALGTTPLSPIALAPGVHTFEFTHPDYRPFRRRITVRAGEEMRLQVDFDTVGVPRQ